MTDMSAPDGNTAESVRYRIVQDEEMLKLRPLFDKLNWPLPDPQFAKLLVAEAGEGDSGVILGFVITQFMLHAEPMWVHPSCRGTEVAEELMQHITHYIEHDCHIQRYICTAKTGSFGARLAEQNGMTPLHGQIVHVKTVESNSKQS